MKTLHDFDGMIIGWIDDKQGKIVISTQRYDVIIPKERGDYVIPKHQSSAPTTIKEES